VKLVQWLRALTDMLVIKVRFPTKDDNSRPQQMISEHLGQVGLFLDVLLGKEIK